MNFDDILLVLIARRARSGYELKKWLDIEGVFIRANADQSQIYRTLRKLAKQEFIEHEIVRKGGPDAKIYRITVTGGDYLLALAESPYEPPARWQEADFFAWITLLGPISPAAIIATIDREIAFRREQIAIYRGREKRLDAGSSILPFDPDFIGELGRELEQYSRESMDRWVEWLGEQRSYWAERLESMPGAGTPLAGR